jgi:hypothetical protein
MKNQFRRVSCLSRDRKWFKMLFSTLRFSSALLEKHLKRPDGYSYNQSVYESHSKSGTAAAVSAPGLHSWRFITQTSLCRHRIYASSKYCIFYNHAKLPLSLILLPIHSECGWRYPSVPLPFLMMCKCNTNSIRLTCKTLHTFLCTSSVEPLHLRGNDVILPRRKKWPIAPDGNAMGGVARDVNNFAHVYCLVVRMRSSGHLWRRLVSFAVMISRNLMHLVDVAAYGALHRRLTTKLAAARVK